MLNTRWKKKEADPTLHSLMRPKEPWDNLVEVVAHRTAQGEALWAESHPSSLMPGRAVPGEWVGVVPIVDGRLGRERPKLVEVVDGLPRGYEPHTSR